MRINRREFVAALGAGGMAAIGHDAESRSGQRVKPGIVLQSYAWINLFGLVGIVRGTSSQPIDVLLVDGKSIESPHTPFLIVEDGHVDPMSDPASSSTLIMSEAGPVACSQWNLTGYQVNVNFATMLGVSSISTQAITGRRNASHRTPATTDESADVSWIAEMKKIPGVSSGKIKAACLSSDPRSANVAARVRFVQGVLGARFEHSGLPHWDNTVFQFKNGTNTYEQALGLGGVRLTLSSARQVVFTLLPFPISSGPSGMSGSKQIIVNNASAALMQFVNEPNTPSVPCPTGFSPLHHFKAFYNLLDTAPSAQPLPACISGCPACPAPGAIVPAETREIYCPPSGFEP